MSSPTVAQIQQQNTNFKAAYDSGKITQTQYNSAMTYQNQQLAQAQAREQPATLPADFVGPRQAPNQQIVSQPVYSQPPSQATPTILPPDFVGPPAPNQQIVSQPDNNIDLVVPTVLPPDFVGPRQAPNQQIAPEQTSLSAPMPSAYWESKTGTPEGYTQIADPKEQTKLNELNQIAEQNKVFIEAQKTGKITGPEYNTAIYSQYERARAIEPSIPEGMIVSNVQTGTGRVGFEPLMIYQSNSFFGVFDPDVAGYGMKGEPIPYIDVKPGNPMYQEGKGMSPAENRALTGLTLATSIAIPLAPFQAASTIRGALSLAKSSSFLAPTVGGAVLTSGAEVYKYKTTGEHLTASEAINTFALGEMAGLGLKEFNSRVVQPKAQGSLSRSYEATMDTETLWKPSLREQVLMKVTGAKPNAPYLQGKATDLLTARYTAQEMVNEKVMFGSEKSYWKPSINEQQTFGFKPVDYQTPKLWGPTTKDTELMSLVGGKIKAPAYGVVSGTNVPKGTLSVFEMEAEGGSFQMGAAPKTSLYTSSKNSFAKASNLKGSTKVPWIIYNNQKTDYQLDTIEQMSKQQLPRQQELQTNSESNVKTDKFGFNKDEVSAKIDAQLKQADPFDSKMVDARIKTVLREAALEKASKPGEFITKINNDKSSNLNVKEGYLIKEPEFSNLNISERIQIRNPNIDVADAKSKMDSLLNDVPAKNNYGDYRATMAEGKTLTATKTNAGDESQIAYLEQMSKQQLPRTSGLQAADNINRMSSLILPNSSLENPLYSSGKNTGLIANINYDKTTQMTKQKMSTQISGADSYTLNLLNRRLQFDNAEQVSEKISNSQAIFSSVNLKNSLGIKEGQMQRQAVDLGLGSAQASGTKQITDQTVGITTGVFPDVYTPIIPKIDIPTNIKPSVFPMLNYPMGNPPGASGFDKYSPFSTKRTRKFLWEFPVMEPAEILGKDWF